MNKQIIDFIRKTLDAIDTALPREDEDGNKISKEDKLTIRKVKQKVKRQFEQDLEVYRGDETIQFPMVFDILLCPEDYQRLEQAIPGALPEFVAAFYGVIKETSNGVEGAVVKNINRYWLFTYGPSDYAKDEDGKPIRIAKGEVITQAALYGEDIRIVAKDTMQGDGDNRTSTRSSVTSITSSLSDGTAFNMDVLAGGYLHANRAISFNFDPNLNTDLDTIIRSRNGSKKVLATLSWFSLNTMEKSKASFQMMESLITISGSEDTRENALGILKVNDKVVKTDHVQIRFDESTKKFQICAYYKDVLAAEKPVPVSERQNPQWVVLPDDCSIVIGNSVTVSFKALE